MGKDGRKKSAADCAKGSGHDNSEASLKIMRTAAITSKSMNPPKDPIRQLHLWRVQNEIYVIKERPKNHEVITIAQKANRNAIDKAMPHDKDVNVTKAASKRKNAETPIPMIRRECR
ncbi:MAG: hypothetical protein LBB65_02605 [Burkholderiales bacterium]|nr:hypothetical protein [Burkholderiales bacterium]